MRHILLILSIIIITFLKTNGQTSLSARCLNLRGYNGWEKAQILVCLNMRTDPLESNSFVVYHKIKSVSHYWMDDKKTKKLEDVYFYSKTGLLDSIYTMFYSKINDSVQMPSLIIQYFYNKEGFLDSIKRNFYALVDPQPKLGSCWNYGTEKIISIYNKENQLLSSQSSQIWNNWLCTKEFTYYENELLFEVLFKYQNKISEVDMYEYKFWVK